MTPNPCKWLIAAVLVGLVSSAAAQSNLSIEGMGVFGNRSLNARLAFLQNLEAKESASLDASLIEDSAFLLVEQLKRDGHLSPTVRAIITKDDQIYFVEWQVPYTTQLEIDATADSILFQIEPGVLFHYDHIQVEGIQQIEADTLQRYFIPSRFLIETKRAKIFTEENLDRRIGRVLRSLTDMGFRKAQAVSRNVEKNAVTGAVSIQLKFDPGPLHQIGRVVARIDRNGVQEETVVEVPAATLLTQEWKRSLQSTFLSDAYRSGYPDAQVRLQLEPGSTSGDPITVTNITIITDWGVPVTLGNVGFKGDATTSRDVLKRQTELKIGGPLNQPEVSEARRKIMALGIYKDVSLRFEPQDGEHRNVIFELEPSTRQELKLLAGWGSYEQLRVGFNWEHRNPFGRAHRYEIEAKKSFKVSYANATYSIPQAFATPAILYSNITYGYREEPSFKRTSQGAAIGITATSTNGLRIGLEYGLFKEQADRKNEEAFESQENATVGSLTLSLNYDQRNDLIAPSAGWNIFGEFKTANEMIGSSVNFQKLEIGGSFHYAISQSTRLHAGLRGGSIFSQNQAETNIPFNERFFNGGENTVRGYREDGASPRDAEGSEIGAETYALLNLEIEQRFHSKFSTILFLDTIVNSRQGFFEEVTDPLYTLGIGLRYKTVIGPVRAEYGHNLNPRENDRAGAFHFSIGFPF